MKHDIYFNEEISITYKVTVENDDDTSLDMALDTLEVCDNIQEAVGKLAMSKGITVDGCKKIGECIDSCDWSAVEEATA